jgi:CobQ/CobB/MinD/ParA nucleotide binding domain
MPKNKIGRIFTFYSFKGGVGRTMAVANLAFIAAVNGKRVLVMDWDMEAPGLAYYFRGLTDVNVMRENKDALGILNLLWKWRNALDSDLELAEKSEQLKAFKSGEIFSSVVHPIVAKRFIGEKGCVDFIGAGSKSIATPNPTAYQDALAKFNWDDFYEKSDGGHLLKALRDWSKSKYDLILIDSRTGFADVAGVCTMQLPDVVALCFTLNRQNIDGTAAVASAVRQNRGETVKLRAIPMRTRRSDTSEQSDAIARAIRALKKTGKFSEEDVERDVKNLAILAADSVPVYETLAPFTARNRSSLDPLTLNYVQVASSLFDTLYVAPELSEELIESVQAMLEPKNATVDFVKGLLTAEPERALNQLTKLIQGVVESFKDAETPSLNYVEAIIEVAREIEGEIEDADEWLELQLQINELLKQLYSDSPSDWGALRLKTLENCQDSVSFMFDEEFELALTEEIVIFLYEYLPKDLKKRIKYQRQLSRLYLNNGKFEDRLLNSIKVLFELIDFANTDLIDPILQHSDFLRVAELDALVLETYLQSNKDIKILTEKYQAAVKLIKNQEPVPTNLEFSKLASELYIQIFKKRSKASTLPNPVDCALEAAKWNSLWHGFRLEFIELAKTIVEDGSTRDVLSFLGSVLKTSDTLPSGRALGSYFSRNAVTASKGLGAFIELLQRILQDGQSPSKNILIGVENVLVTVINTLFRTKRVSAKLINDSIGVKGPILAGLLGNFGHSSKSTEVLLEKLQMPPSLR